MSLSENLNEAFDQFISSRTSSNFLRSIAEGLDEGDVEVLIFVSALLISLGEPAIKRAAAYADSRHPYVPWMIKYAEDPRFHADIKAKFSDVF